MQNYERKVTGFIKKHSLIREGDSILAAVSGGPDSLSLLYFLNKYKRLWDARIAAVCVDHMFRGEQSYEELLFVKKTCEKMGIPFYGERVNVQEILEESNTGLQEGARNVRYEIFAKVMKEEGFTKLAFGHHGDDQVETILMRMTRGSSGLLKGGIPVRRVFHGAEIIRPLLCLSKEEISVYCSDNGLEPRLDPSNEKLDYTRNRFRQKVLPFLKLENPQVHLKFQQFSEETAEDEEYLLAMAEEKMDSVITKTMDEAVIDIQGFRMMPLPLQRRMIHLILNYLYKERPSSLSSIHIQDVVAIIMKDSPSLSLDLPGNLKAIRSYNQCILTFDGRAEGTSDFCYTLNIGERIELPGQRAFALQKAENHSQEGDSVLFDKSRVAFPFRIRNRRPGDRIKVKGLNGTKKVKDIFIDEKIPVSHRDTWPVVEDNNGEILWLPKLKVSSLSCEEPSDINDCVRLIFSEQTSS
ncbi:tRNA lysidine(34) synthetase TilS [Bacillus salacetis]|uniref:tRNA lysidine(34) synthetase TilS n=1 Tax=Bacillus salacetis TaxID=2315464 RepID=UPI001F0CB3C9|nr:tRNA lysidine(34) synthetase TilS [Bacillus salacetis]